MDEKDINYNTEPQAASPEAEQIPSVQPQQAYTYYSDGTSRHGTPTTDRMSYGHAPRKSKSGVVLICLSAVMLTLILVLTAVVVYYIREDSIVDDGVVADADDSSNGTGVIGSYSTPSNDLSTAESTPKELPGIVTTAPVPENSYDSLVELYNECSPSCVTVICTVEVNYGYYTMDGTSLGSGFIVESSLGGEYEGKKYIITNHHVIEDAKDITVRFYDDSEYAATLVASDSVCDIAVLTIEKDDMVALEMGDSDELYVGQWVVAIGTPSDEELAGTMSYGIVSGINRELDITNDYGTVVKTMTVIQTTATLNPGNSGGPLINMAGQVVGINAMKLSDEYEGIGFALPSTSAADIINSLIVYGDTSAVDRGFAVGAAQLGITCSDVTDAIIQQYRLGSDCPKGVLVVALNPGTAVYEAGLSQYDVITTFNGVELSSFEDLKAQLAECKAGDYVEMTFYRPNRRGGTGTYYTINFRLDNAS